MYDEYQKRAPCTASHSFRSSPSGKWTASLKFPDPYQFKVNPHIHDALYVTKEQWVSLGSLPHTSVADIVSCLPGRPYEV